MAARKTTAKSNVSAKDLLQHYKDMLLIRRFEEKAGQLYGMGLIGGFCHLYIGQEAVVVGLEAAAKEGDKRLTSYRDHGHMLACGMDPNGVMAELTGREGGYSKGKGGSMHMFSEREALLRRPRHRCCASAAWCGSRLLQTNIKAMTTSPLPISAMAQPTKAKSTKPSTWPRSGSCPCIFVIENNQYAMGTSQQRSTSSPDFHTRGDAFGIPGEAVDGMDVLAVKEAGEAVAHCRAGKGPYISGNENLSLSRSLHV